MEFNFNKALKRATRIGNEKKDELKARDDRKLRIKKKKLFIKVKENENDNEM